MRDILELIKNPFYSIEGIKHNKRHYKHFKQ